MRIYFDTKPKVFRAPNKCALLMKILADYTFVSTINGSYYSHWSGKHVRVFSLQKFRLKTSRDTIESWDGYERTITHVIRRPYWEAHVYDLPVEILKFFRVEQGKRTFKLIPR